MTLREQFADLWHTIMRPVARHWGWPVMIGLGPAYWFLRQAGDKDRADRFRDRIIREAQGFTWSKDEPPPDDVIPGPHS